MQNHALKAAVALATAVAATTVAFGSAAAPSAAQVAVQAPAEDQRADDRRREFREIFGLDASREHMRRVKSAHDSGDRAGTVKWEGDIYLTTEEADDLTRRNRLADEDAPSLKAEIGPRAFGGYYIDNTGPYKGKLVVWVTESGAPAADRARSRAQQPERIVFRPARFSLDEKVEVTRQIIDAKADIEEPGHRVVAVGLDQVKDRVTVGVQEPTSRQRRLIAERWGPYDVVVEPSTLGVAVGNYSPSAPPLRAASRINPKADGSYHPEIGSNACTSNYSGYIDTSAGKKYMSVTAGHCAGIGNVMTVAGTVIGRIDRSAWQFNHSATISTDSGAAPTTGTIASSQIYNCEADIQEVDRFMQPRGDVAGYRVNISTTDSRNQGSCFSVGYGAGEGYPGYYRCYRNDVTNGGGDACVYGVRQVDMNHSLWGGDSGSPVYSRGSDNRIVGIGMAVAKPNVFDDTVAWYNTVDEMKTTLGLSGWCATATVC